MDLNLMLPVGCPDLVPRPVPGLVPGRHLDLGPDPVLGPDPGLGLGPVLDPLLGPGLTLTLTLTLALTLTLTLRKGSANHRIIREADKKLRWVR